jgi:hypothetical protein
MWVRNVESLYPQPLARASAINSAGENSVAPRLVNDFAAATSSVLALTPP